jgi:hypothetical protein
MFVYVREEREREREGEERDSTEADPRSAAEVPSGTAHVIVKHGECLPVARLVPEAHLS